MSRSNVRMPKAIVLKKRIYDPNKIRKARSDAGFTRTALAAQIGVSESLISLYESGKRENPETITKIAKALNLRPSDFHYEEHELSPTGTDVLGKHR